MSATTVSDTRSASGEQRSRLDWVDLAKGFCIIMVVALHATWEIEEATGHQGFMGYVVTFSRAFRMPDFFLISGLFVARMLKRDWRSFIDSKVLHFLYFYFIWVTIHYLVKAPGYLRDHQVAAGFQEYLWSFVQPLGTLWFIYILPIFFVTTRLVRRVPPVVIFALAAALEIAHVKTGWILIDQFASRFVYFYTGFWLAPKVFALAAWVRSSPRVATLALLVWAVINGAVSFAGYGALPFVSLALGFAGAAAVVSFSVLLTKVRLADPLRYCGRNSIVIYLAFFLPMHATKAVLLKTGVIADSGWMSLAITIAAIAGALILWWSVRNTRLSFLFSRPKRLYIDRTSEEPAFAPVAVPTQPLQG